jgi:hypothetical protein
MRQGYFKKQYPCKSTFCKRGYQSPGLKVAKDCLSLLLGSRVEEAYKLKTLMVCHPENPQALNVKDHLPTYFYSTVNSWLKSNDICNYLTSKLESELKQYVKQEN